MDVKVVVIDVILTSASESWKEVFLMKGNTSLNGSHQILKFPCQTVLKLLCFLALNMTDLTKT